MIGCKKFRIEDPCTQSSTCSRHLFIKCAESELVTDFNDVIKATKRRDQSSASKRQLP